MKSDNKKLKQIRLEIGELQASMFKNLGGEESYRFRVKLGEIANEILTKMKENQINGDESVTIFQ